MFPDTADSTGRYNNSNLLPHIPMNPAYILSICNMSIFFVHWSFITIFIMLLVSLPSHLQNKWVKTNTVKPFVICDAMNIVLSPK